MPTWHVAFSKCEKTYQTVYTIVLAKVIVSGQFFEVVNKRCEIAMNYDHDPNSNDS